MSLSKAYRAKGRVKDAVAILDQYKDKKTIVIFKSRKEADLYLEKLSF